MLTPFIKNFTKKRLYEKHAVCNLEKKCKEITPENIVNFFSAEKGFNVLDYGTKYILYSDYHNAAFALKKENITPEMKAAEEHTEVKSYSIAKTIKNFSKIWGIGEKQLFDLIIKNDFERSLKNGRNIMG